MSRKPEALSLSNFDSKVLAAVKKEAKEKICLASLNQLEASLQKAETCDEAKKVYDVAEHIRRFIEQQRFSEEVEQRAVQVKARALIWIDDLKNKIGVNKGGRRRKTETEKTSTNPSNGFSPTSEERKPTLAELGIPPNLSSKAKKYNKIPKKKFEDALTLPANRIMSTLDELARGVPGFVSVKWQVVDRIFKSANKELGRLGYQEKPFDDSFYKRITDSLTRGARSYIEPPQELLTTALIIGLKDRNAEEVASMLGVSRLSEALEYRNLQQDLDGCKNTSLLFNSHRLSVKFKDKKSVIESLKSEEFLSALAGLILRLEDKPYPLAVRHILRALAVGTYGQQLAFEFPPLLARKYCRDYFVPEDGRVLDPCAGWGGRMLGVSTVCRNYTCYEPATQTYNGLRELEKFIKLLNRNFNAEIVNEPFEDSKLEAESFDFAITSPPYFDTEIYCDEQTNSCNKYRSFEAWCDGFFFPMVSITMDALKPGKVFILHIGGHKYPLYEVLKENFEGTYNLEPLGESFYRILKP